MKQYSVAALNVATRNFDGNGILGRGGFGIVYKGLLEGVAVAVKRMGTAHRTVEMRRERERCATLNHRRLVPCLGMVRAREPVCGPGSAAQACVATLPTCACAALSLAPARLSSG